MYIGKSNFQSNSFLCTNVTLPTIMRSRESVKPSVIEINTPARASEGILHTNVTHLKSNPVQNRTHVRCPLEDIYFMWTFNFLFLLLTAVGMFPPRWEHSHRGENILTAVETFPPRWEHSHRGENILTTVRTFPPRWEHSHCGEKYFHRGGKSRDLWRHLRAPPSRADMRHHSSHYWNSMEHRQAHSTRVWVPTIKYNKVWVPTTKYHSLWAPTIKYTRVWLPIVKYTRVWAPTIKYN